MTNEPQNREPFFRIWCYRLLLASIFGIALSIALGEIFLSLSTVCWLIGLYRRELRPSYLPIMTPLLAFLGAVVVSSLAGVRPAASLWEARELFWFVLLPIAASTVSRWEQVRQGLVAFALGAGALAIKVGIEHPVDAWVEWQARQSADYDYLVALIDKGSMTDGQMLMLGWLAALGLGMAAMRGRRPVGRWLALLVLLAVANIVNFKRGSWICAGALSVLLVALQFGWRYTVLCAVAAVALIFLPPVATRLQGLKEEFRVDKGGRLAMWVKVAPPMIREHPLGIGYGIMTNEMMKKAYRKVEPHRNHLHSNGVQILVATGWLGLAVYLAWMAIACWQAARLTAATRGTEWGLPALILLCLLLGLLANGVVEYNFGDTELRIVLAAVLGLVGVGLRSVAAAEPAAANQAPAT